jgi:ABC-type phosphate/phosphonate transport system ATPase subunit
MVFGPSGISKTYFTLAWALSICAGRRFLNWQTPAPRGVLYIDGELGERTMQQRVKALQSGHEIVRKAPFYVASFDSQAAALFPDLEDESQQPRYLLGIPDDVQLVFLDSLSTLAALNDSNDAKSWGPVQRMLLARIFILRPQVLIAAEPTSMVDACSRANILDYLMKLKEELKMTIVFVTHDIGLAYYVSDSIYIMHKGQIVEQGPPDQVTQHPQSATTRQLLDDIPDIHRDWVSRSATKATAAG